MRPSQPLPSASRVLLTIALTLVSSTTLAAQAWFNAATSGFQPPPRRNHAMAYVPEAQSLVIFGGIGSNGLQDDMAVLRDMQWSQVNGGPQERQDTAMAYDKHRKVLLVYGGRQTGLSFGYSDTWTFDGTSWSLQTQNSNPGGRYGHAMAYDPVSQRIVMFGGNNGANQTWVWDGTEWLASFTPNFPPGRRYHTMALDEQLQRVVLVGGTDGTTTFGDTWIWNGSTWIQSAATLPARSNHAMAYDLERQRMIVSGGTAGGTTLSSTYEFDGVAWTDITGPSPQARRDFSMAYDETLGRVVRWGGFSTSLLQFPQANRPLGVAAAAFPYGEGCGQPALELRNDPTARPVLGQTGGALIREAPTAFAGLMIGFNDQTFLQYQLPVTLGILGMNGCDLLQSLDVFGLPATPLGPGTLRATTFVPSNQSLIGAHAFLQAYCFAPGANALELIVSNGLDWRFGAL